MRQPQDLDAKDPQCDSLISAVADGVVVCGERVHYAVGLATLSSVAVVLSTPQQASAAIASEVPIIGALNSPAGQVFDAAGNDFIANDGSSTVSVIPAVTGTLFGQSVTANKLTSLTAATGLASPHGLAFDAAGDLFISNTNGGTVTVVPKTTTTLFGQSVTANTAVALAPITTAAINKPLGIGFDSAGDLFVTGKIASTVTVLAKTTTALFGQSVTANVAATLTAATGLNEPSGVAFDLSGNLLIANEGNSTVSIVPKATGTFFGQSVTANTVVAVTAFNSHVSFPTAITFDAAGDCIADSGLFGTVDVLAKSTGTLYGQSMTANAVTQLTVLSGSSSSDGFALDASGDILDSNDTNFSVTVLPKSAGTLFGQSLTGSTAVALAPTTVLLAPTSICFDTAGDLFTVNSTGNSVAVLAKSSGTIFGQSVAANVFTTLNAVTGLSSPSAIAIDGAGDLYILNNGDISVVAAVSGSIFGQSVAANTTATLAAASGLPSPRAIAIDPSGNFYATNFSGSVSVLAKSSGLLFGQSVTANTLATLTAATGLNGPLGITFDAAGDLFITNNISNFLSVIPKSSGTIFGQSVTASVATHLTAATGLSAPLGAAFDASGNLYIANTNDAITVLPNASTTLFGQSVTANTNVALSAANHLDSPTSVAFDPAGNLFILDNGSLLNVDVRVAPSIGTSTLPNGALGATYSQSVSGIGGVTNYSWTVQSGVLPSGLALAATTGVLSGTPTAAGTFPFTIAMADSVGEVATASLSITVPLATTSVALTATPNPALPGQVVTFVATVSGRSPTGLVTFADGGTSIGNASLDGNGNAVFATSILSATSHGITATFGGDSSNATSLSATLIESVTPADQPAVVTSTTLAPPPVVSPPVVSPPVARIAVTSAAVVVSGKLPGFSATLRCTAASCAGAISMVRAYTVPATKKVVKVESGRKVTVTETYAKPVTQLLATLSYRLAAGKSKAFAVLLNAAGRSQLATVAKSHLHEQLKATVDGGKTTTRVVSVS